MNNRKCVLAHVGQCVVIGVVWSCWDIDSRQTYAHEHREERKERCIGNSR